MCAAIKSYKNKSQIDGKTMNIKLFFFLFANFLAISSFARTFVYIGPTIIFIQNRFLKNA